MPRRTYFMLALAWAALPASVAGQERLGLADAIARATATHPSAQIAATAAREAETRVTQAQGQYFPRLDLTEGWQRGNQPVFVFSSLLSQRQFAEANFAIDALNYPDAMSNHRLFVSVQQLVFDGMATPAAVKAAKTGVSAAAQQRAMTTQALALGVTQAFGAAVRADAEVAAAASAVAASEEDLKRVTARRDAGFATEADVLSLQVQVAEMRAAEVAASGQARVARAQLNELIGAPLDASWALDLGAPAQLTVDDGAALEAEALANRPEVRLAALQIEGAQAGYTMARAAWLPQVAFQSGWEFNGETFGDRASSWIVGAELRLNLFRGGADSAKVTEARLAVDRQRLERQRVEQQTRLDVRMAQARLQASLARSVVSRDALARARESQRIVRDRYEAGLEDVTSLLRASQGVRQAEALEISTRVGVLVDTAALERALGRLPN